MKELLEKLENSPSILSIEDELFFIDRLQTLPIDEIRENKEIFKRIISAIQESHQDNGIFEITDLKSADMIYCADDELCYIYSDELGWHGGIYKLYKPGFWKIGFTEI